MRITARAEKRGTWWVVDVPQIPGLLTQAKTREEIPVMVLDAAELLTGRSDYEVSLEIVPPQEALLHLEASARLEAEAAAANSASAKERREAVRVLRSQGYTLDDVGELLGVSKSRAQQLAS